jgi:hypothetical protein
MRANSACLSSTSPAKSQEAPGPLANRLLVDISELSKLTSLSVRTLRRLDASRDIPGRVLCGRRVLFQTELIREWVRAGLPSRDQWTGLLKRSRG